MRRRNCPEVRRCNGGALAAMTEDMAPNPSAVLRDLIRSGEAGRLREAAGLSQATMAAGLGVSRKALSRIENGHIRTPRYLDFAGRYLRVLQGLARHEAVTEEMATAWQVA
jgi:DNA-binding XRE family transcriptional regulator